MAASKPSAEQLITDNIDVWTSAIKKKSSQGRGASKKQEMYGIKKLRELILELAMRGLLVPQNSSDEPASVLLENIAAEKKQLLKNGKLKKQKELLPITGDEVPFELPSGWLWTRISEIGHDWGQKKPEGEFTYIDVGSINKELGYIQDPTILLGSEAPSRARKVVKKGTVIYSTIRPYLLNIAVINDEFNPEPIASTAFSIVHPYSGISSFFVYSYLRSPSFVSYVESVQAGIAYPAINDKQFSSGLFPIAPEVEQLRIDAKVNELMALCDQLEEQTESSLTAHQSLVETLLNTLLTAAQTTGTKESNPQSNSNQESSFDQAWNRIAQHFDVLFTTEHSIDQLKQTILQLAVMGKLVPQDPSDEPASVLLEKIAAEKEQLIKDKKIKKDKPISLMSAVEKPFELPAGWEWCRFEDVVNIQSGITKGKNLKGRETIMVPYLSVANVQRSYLSLDYVKEVEIPIEEKGKYEVLNGDLLITEGGDWDKVGRTAIWRDGLEYVAHQNHVFKARPFLLSQSEVWLETYLNSPFSRNYFAGSSKQTTNLASINKTQLRGCLIAVPPAGEKDRIVAKIGDLMSLCDSLKLRVSESQGILIYLADAMAEQALN